MPDFKMENQTVVSSQEKDRIKQVEKMAEVKLNAPSKEASADLVRESLPKVYFDIRIGAISLCVLACALLLRSAPNGQDSDGAALRHRAANGGELQAIVHWREWTALLELNFP